ncbi:hypothetical protein GCM10027290_28930 [Micromonospora sonneratiae]|uniref:Uncharacterized protein n=1 Tax=Micromonospora sonneratiae TaxID=1184706 RepID=A0ABW3Y761_9ACTN
MASGRSDAYKRSPVRGTPGPLPPGELAAATVPAPWLTSDLLRLQATGGNALVVQLLQGTRTPDPAAPSDAGRRPTAYQRSVGGRPAHAPTVPVQRAGGSGLVVARDPEDGAAPTPGIPGRYAGIVTPSLNESDRRMLHQVAGGADIVETIQRRDATRLQMAEIERAMDTGRGDMSEGTAVRDYERLSSVERQLTGRIDAQLAELGVADENELLRLVNDRFPTRFLAEAKQVALDMLGHNEAEARGELDRYSAQVCSPDVDGLLAADRTLAELYPTSIEHSIRAAETALSRYQPSAGVPSAEELAAAIPANEQSVMVDIANLDRNRARLEQQRSVYNAARYAYGRQFPILLSSGYRPGTFAGAPPEQLGRLVAEPVTEILENIARVRDAINDDELKVWNMRDVLRITEERLGVRHPVLRSAVEARIASVQRDESFMAWVTAALAISTTVLAGMLFTPAAGAAVAAAWGTAGLLSSIDTYLNESAAENIALDPAVADLSLNEPTLTWVLIDALFLALDLGTVARALRPAARLLTATPNALALQSFRRSAVTHFGEDTAEALTRRAATRHGIETAGLQVAEQQLAQARQVLAGLDLSDDAIVRVLAKGSDVNQLKGQLFEEVMHADVARRLASGGADVLGVAETAGLELVHGHRITDLAGRQLTDGMIVRRLADGSMEIVTVLEAKAGRSAAQGLRTTSHGIGDPEEFARFMIEENRSGVVRALRDAGLPGEAQQVAAGGRQLSEAAIEAVTADRRLRRAITQAELGGQVRRDVERLSPSVGDGAEVAAHLDEVPAQILVDGVPTTVRISPTRTRFVGAVPQDVPMDAITGSLRREGFSFEPLAVGERAADLTARAERLAEQAASAGTSGTPPAP